MLSCRAAGALWLTAGLAGAFALGLAPGPLRDARWLATGVQFWSITIGAGLCVALALAVVVAGWRRQLAEVGLLGGALTVLSLLAVAHGAATPGVLLGPNPVAAGAGIAALPTGLLAGLPLLAPGLAASRWVARRWRWWVSGWVAAVALGASVALATGRWPLAVADVPAVLWALVALTVLGVGRLVLRQLALYEIGRRWASLWTAGAAITLAVAMVMMVAAPASSPLWWLAHAIDTAAVLIAGLGLIMAAQAGRGIPDLLAPAVNHDPLTALDLGLAPEVHAFVRALERKDPQTRDHVVRVARLVMRLGERAGLPPARLRDLGLAGLLHDIGKLVVPADVLRKPDQLTNEEFALIRTHSERGAALLAASPTLAGIADLVRWHHERWDGGGYPDGLDRTRLPLEAALVSVCDAWDAITNQRWYQEARTVEQAREIMLAGTGTQWSPDAVALLLAEVKGREVRRDTAFAEVGRDPARV